MLRTASAALILSAAAMLLGCPRESGPQYAGGQYPPQPGYQPQPGYPPQPGYQPQPGYPPAPQPGYQPAPAPYPQPAPAPQPQPGTAPGGWPFPFPPPPGTQPQPGPAPQPGQPPQPGGGQATLLDPAAAAAATGPLTFLAQSEMQGMQPATDVVAAQAQQGQYMEQTFQMAGGKCYGAVAAGAGVSGIKIEFVALQPIPGVTNPVLAEQSGGSQTALGGRGNCFKWAVPIGVNVKAVYTATAGSGVMAGRVYVK